MTNGQAAADSFIRGLVSRSGPELILATKPFAVDSTARSWWYILSTTALLVAEKFMWVFGILALSPSSIWRASHNHHHNHNSKIKGSHIGSFPIMTREHFEKAPRRARWLYLFMRHPLTILLGYLTIFLHGMCMRPFVMKPQEHWDCLIAVVVHAVIAGCLIGFVGWQGWLLTQILPHFIASGIGSYLFYAQHNFPGVAFYDKSGWTYDRAALDSCSYLKMGPVMAWFTANIGYHHIHHLNARIPFYRLPEVLQAMPELRNPKVTTLNPIEIYRCLCLKVWDVKQQQMVAVGAADGEQG